MRRERIPLLFSLCALLAAGMGTYLQGEGGAEIEILDPELVTVTDTTFILTWRTNLPTDARVRYGTSPRCWEEVVRSAEEATRYHMVEVGGLSPGVTYFYEIESGGVTGRPTPLSPGVVQTLVPPPGPLRFRFATMNDMHVGEETAGLILLPPDIELCPGFSWPDPQTPYWRFMNEAAVAEINEAGVDFVVVKGDITAEARREEFVWAKEILDALTVPYYVLRGNHDRQGERLDDPFLEVFGLDRSFYTFDEQDYRMIALDSVEPRSGIGEISEAQFEWLAEVLDESRQKRVMIFLHHPVALQVVTPGMAVRQPDAARLLALLAPYDNIVGIFSGHTHRNQIRFAPASTGRAPLAETAATKEYPGGYTLYSVFEGGYMQSFYEVRCPECREWSETTRQECYGTLARNKLGTLHERNYV
ncbi:MAG: metallophosphoesterase family protein, partial [Deltaproteobacteria bacterium]